MIPFYPSAPSNNGIALNYYAQGSFMNEIASHHGIHKMSVSNGMHRMNYLVYLTDM